MNLASLNQGAASLATRSGPSVPPNCQPNDFLSSRNDLLSGRNSLLSTRNELLSIRRQLLTGPNGVLSKLNRLLNGRNALLSARCSLLCDYCRYFTITSKENSFFQLIQYYHERLIFWSYNLSLHPLLPAKESRYKILTFFYVKIKLMYSWHIVRCATFDSDIFFINF